MLLKKVLSFPVIKQVIEASRLIKPWGFEGSTLYDIGYFFFIEVGKSAVTTRASAVAFKFFLALFPALIFLFTLIPYLPLNDLHEQIMLSLKDFMPTNAYQAAVDLINDLLTNQRGGLLSFGFFITLYFATNGINALMEAFNKSLHIKETRTFIMQRVISLFLFFMLSILLLLAASIIIFSEITLDYFIDKGLLISDTLSIILLTVGKWVVVILLLFFAISILFFFGPVNRKRYDFFSPGSTLATVLFIFASQMFSYYVNNFGTYNKVYGSIGTIMVVMLWLEFVCLIMIVGFDLNAKIYSNRKLVK